MKISFKETDAKKIVKTLADSLEDRELGKICKFSLDGNNIIITISKMGTSEIVFAGKPAKDGMEFALSKEKIAFTHRPFKDEVIDKIRKVVSGCGGTVS